jgi:hypothetical protein
MMMNSFACVKTRIDRVAYIERPITDPASRVFLLPILSERCPPRRLNIDEKTERIVKITPT